IIGLTYARGVDDRYRVIIEIELHLNDVARGAGMWRDDRDLAPRQLVHQRRLAHIRWTRDRDHQPLAQPLALSVPGKDLLDFAQQRSGFCERWRDQLGGHIALVREIDSGFDQGAGFDDLRAPIARPVAEQTLQLTQRLAALSVG